MAVNVAELLVKIGADTKGLKDGVAEADSVIGKLGNTAKGVAAVGIGGLVTGVGALALGLNEARNKAADFEQGMANIKAVSGASAAEMDQLSGKALQIGKDTSFSATEAADAIEELVKAGVSIPDVMGGAADATVALAAAAGIKIPEAATIASNAMNQFHMTAAQMPQIADLIAGAANASAIDVNQFGFSLQSVGAVANLAGVSFKDTATAIALLGNAGIVGSDAGTSLKSMFQSLIPQSKQQVAAFQELGLMTKEGTNAFYDQQGKLKSLADVSQILQASMKNLTKEQQQAYLTTIFGSDGIRAAAILADQGSEGFNKLATAMGAVSAQDVAKTRLDSTKGSMEALSGSIETLEITVGRFLLPGLNAGVKGVTGFVNALIPVAEKYMPMIVGAIAPIQEAIEGRLVKGLQVAATAATTFATALFHLGGAQSGATMLTGWQAQVAGFANTIRTEVVPAVLRFGQEVVSLVQTAWPYLQRLGQGFVTEVIPAILSLGRTALDTFQTKIVPLIRNQVLPAFAQIGQFVVTTLIPALGKLAEWVVSTLIPAMVTFYADVLVKVIAGIQATAGFVTGTLIPAIQALSAWLQANVFPVLEQFAAWFNASVVPAVRALADIVTSTVIPALEALGTFIVTVVVAAAKQLADWFVTNVMPALTQFAGFVATTVIPALQTFADFIVNTVIPTVQRFVGFIADHWPEIWAVIGPVLEQVKTGIEVAWNAARAIVAGVLDVMATTIRTAWNTFQNIVDTGMNLIRGVLQTIAALIHGDWSGAWTKLKETGQVLWDGIKTQFGIFTDALQQVLSTILTTLGSLWENAWNGIKQTLANVWDATGGIRDIAKTGIDAVHSAIDTAKDKILSAIKWPFEQARDVIGAIMSAFKENLLSPFRLAAEGINTFLGGIRAAVNWVGEHVAGKTLIADGALQIPAFAAGGVAPGGPIIAGEAGAELLMPPKGTRVFNAAETVEIFRAVYGQGPEGAPLGAAGLRGLGGFPGVGSLVDWAKGAKDAVADTAREFLGKAVDAIVSEALGFAGIGGGPSGLTGAFAGIGSGMLGTAKDLLVDAVKSIKEKVTEALPAAGGMGGLTGNAILDMAQRVKGAYMLCEKFVGDVMQALGLRYARAGTAQEHADSQPLNPGFGPAGTIEFFRWGELGHVGFNVDGKGLIFGTLDNEAGTGFANVGLPPEGWTATPFADGGIVTRPTLGLVGEAGPEAIIPLKGLGGGPGGLDLTGIQDAIRRLTDLFANLGDTLARALGGTATATVAASAATVHYTDAVKQVPKVADAAAKQIVDSATARGKDLAGAHDYTMDHMIANAKVKNAELAGGQSATMDTMVAAAKIKNKELAGNHDYTMDVMVASAKLKNAELAGNQDYTQTVMLASATAKNAELAGNHDYTMDTMVANAKIKNAELAKPYDAALIHITAAVQGAAGAIAEVANGLVTMSNGVLAATNKLKTDPVGKYLFNSSGQAITALNFGQGGTYVTPTKLAAGGIVTDPTLAMVGEDGAEAVIPLGRLGALGGPPIVIHVHGSVLTPTDLANAVHAALLRKKDMTGKLGLD